MKSGPVHQNAPSDADCARSAGAMVCATSPHTHWKTWRFATEGSEQCFQSMVCTQSMKVVVELMAHDTEASTGFAMADRNALVPMDSKRLMMEMNSLPAMLLDAPSCRPISRMRPDMRCERHTPATALASSRCVALFWLITTTFGSVWPEAASRTTETRSVAAQDMACTALMDAYTGSRNSDAMKLVRAVVDMK